MEEKILKESIESLANKFFESSLNFLYEYDLQSYLYGELFKRFENIEFSLPAEEYGDYVFENNKLIINPVKCEYPYDEIFDISIIDDKQDANRIVDCSNVWNLDVKIAIELKYCLLGNKPHYRYMYFSRDIDKLKKYKMEKNREGFIGIGLYFVQSNKEDVVKNFVHDLEESEINICSGINSYIFVNGRIYKDNVKN